MNHQQIIQQSILRDMSEGVMIIGFDGVIRSVNPAACQILDRQESELQGQPFAACFFEYGENDGFNQTILDAIYDTATRKRVVSYFTGRETRQLQMTSSFLREQERKIAVIVVLSDMSELAELRDAVKAMEQIKTLNAGLELRNHLISETFGRYLSDEIVKKLLDTPDGLRLGGKKQLLTVLMSDLRGFTAISERMDAQHLLSMLNHYLGAMTEIIQRRGGTIIEFIGDGILAVFGAPEASQTHGPDAAACAVEMQSTMDRINQWNRARGYPDLEMGIGVNTGEMIVGNIGSEKRTKYGVVGEQVNLCGRIESYTVGGQILLSPRTMETITTPTETAGTFEIYPKGVKNPLTVTWITALGAPYEVRCPLAQRNPKPLPAPLEVCYYLTQDKHCQDSPKKGWVTALSGEAALLQTETDLRPFTDLKLELDFEEFFAKVIRRENDSYFLRFTSRPPGRKIE